MAEQKHQSIQKVETRKVVTISAKELTANWRCAASLAEKEGMTGTAERLRHDADTFDQLYANYGSFTIEVN